MVMVNGAAVLAQIQAGQTPPGWTVFRAQVGFFVRYIILGIILIAIGVVLAVVLTSDPNHVFVLTSVGDTGPATLDQATFDRWRVADMVGVAIFARVGLMTAARYSFDLARRSQSFLAILPDAVVVQRGSTKVYPFAAIQRIKPTASRTQATLSFTMKPGANPIPSRLVIDGRFGRPATIANQIVSAWNRVPKPA
jgi:hypothetical protein